MERTKYAVKPAHGVKHTCQISQQSEHTRCTKWTHVVKDVHSWLETTDDVRAWFREDLERTIVQSQDSLEFCGELVIEHAVLSPA